MERTIIYTEMDVVAAMIGSFSSLLFLPKIRQHFHSSVIVSAIATTMGFLSGSLALNISYLIPFPIKPWFSIFLLGTFYDKFSPSIKQ